MLYNHWVSNEKIRNSYLEELIRHIFISVKNEKLTGYCWDFFKGSMGTICMFHFLDKEHVVNSDVAQYFKEKDIALLSKLNNQKTLKLSTQHGTPANLFYLVNRMNTKTSLSYEPILRQCLLSSLIDLFDFLNAKSYSFKISYILFIKLYILLYKIKELNIYTHFTYKLLELFLVKTKIEGHDSSTNDLLLKTFQNNTFSVLELHEQFNRKNEIIEKRNRMQKIEWISEIELIIRGLHTQSASKANLKMTTLLNIIEYSIKHEKLSLGINGYSGLGLLVLSILDESYTEWDEILLLR